MYHRVDCRVGDPKRELLPALDVRRFRAHLRHLIACYDVVPASQLLAAVKGRRKGQRLPVAITFDDDLPTHARVVAPVLEDRGASATFFLCGASLERPYAFWWERLQRAFDCGIAVGPLIAQASAPHRGAQGLALHEAAGLIQTIAADARAALAERLHEAVGPDPADAGMRAADVHSLVADGLEIGFHTRDHHTLPTLDDVALCDALRIGRAELESVSRTALDLIAYPFGEADGRVADAARQAGFRLGFTTRPEPVRPDSDPLLLGRYEVPIASFGAFVFGVARSLCARPHR